MTECKVALCLWGMMRGPKNCLPTLYENIIKPWGLDVIACVNKRYFDDLDRLNILETLGAKIIEKNIETQIDIHTYFPESFYKKLIPLAQNKLKKSEPYWVNFLGPLVGTHSSLHIRLNWFRMSLILEKYLKEYDFFIITRPDHLYLFPLFGKSFLEKQKIIHYDEHSWGGLNADFVIIHKDLVIDWLQNSIKYLIQEELQDIIIKEFKNIKIWNSEAYTNLIIRLCGWQTKSMSINSFISADCLDEETSYNKIKYDGKYYYKYESNYFPCVKNLNLWKNGARWENFEDKISLSNI